MMPSTAKSQRTRDTLSQGSYVVKVVVINEKPILSMFKLRRRPHSANGYKTTQRLFHVQKTHRENRCYNQIKNYAGTLNEHIQIIRIMSVSQAAKIYLSE